MTLNIAFGSGYLRSAPSQEGIVLMGLMAQLPGVQLLRVIGLLYLVLFFKILQELFTNGRAQAFPGTQGMKMSLIF